MLLDLNEEELSRLNYKLEILRTVKMLEMNGYKPKKDIILLDIMSIYEGSTMYYRNPFVIFEDLLCDIIQTVSRIDEIDESVLQNIIKNYKMNFSCDELREELEEGVYMEIGFKELEKLQKSNIDINNEISDLISEMDDYIDGCISTGETIMYIVNDNSIEIIFSNEWFLDVYLIKAIADFVCLMVNKYKEIQEENK